LFQIEELVEEKRMSVGNDIYEKFFEEFKIVNVSDEDHEQLKKNFSIPDPSNTKKMLAIGNLADEGHEKQIAPLLGADNSYKNSEHMMGLASGADFSNKNGEYHSSTLIDFSPSITNLKQLTNTSSGHDSSHKDIRELLSNSSSADLLVKNLELLTTYPLSLNISTAKHTGLTNDSIWTNLANHNQLTTRSSVSTNDSDQEFVGMVTGQSMNAFPSQQLTSPFVNVSSVVPDFLGIVLNPNVGVLDYSYSTDKTAYFVNKEVDQPQMNQNSSMTSKDELILNLEKSTDLLDEPESSISNTSQGIQDLALNSDSDRNLEQTDTSKAQDILDPTVKNGKQKILGPKGMAEKQTHLDPLLLNGPQDNLDPDVVIGLNAVLDTSETSETQENLDLGRGNQTKSDSQMLVAALQSLNSLFGVLFN